MMYNTVKQSIKQQIMIRVALIFCVVIISGGVTIWGMSKVRGYSKSTEQATSMHTLVLTAEKSHYSWVENLSSSIAMGTEFTGTTDYRSCTLGRWLYDSNNPAAQDRELQSIIEEIKSIHQVIHESAQTILNTSDSNEANRIYLENTMPNVDKLIALLDKVAASTEQQMDEDQAGLVSWVSRTEIIYFITILVILMVSILFVFYIFKEIIHPVEVITESSKE